MYILPNTKIRLIKNCPLDKNYENTIYFTSLAAQTTYFTSTLTGMLFNANSYQRVNKGTLRVAVNAEGIYNYNYLAFQNTSFGDRWFYAFITNIEYINNVTSEITYEIDLLQTWHFSYELEQCFVEREHSVTDAIGDNLVQEKFDTGEYISDDLIQPSQLSGNASRKLCFWATFYYQDEDHKYVDGGGELFNQGHGYYYSGLSPTTFPMTDSGLEDAQDWLSGIHANKINGLVSACIIPAISENADTSVNDVTVTKKTTLLRSDGTNVKNNKCLTYPFNFLYVSNNQGKSAIYRYEFFSTNSCVLHLFSEKSCNPTVLLYPLNYKGLSVNFDERIDFSGYPQVAMSIDSYKAWLAQSASSVGINAMSFGMGIVDYQLANMATKTAVASGATTIPAMAGMEMASLGAATIPLVALAGLAVSGTIHSTFAPQTRGSQGTNVLLGLDRLNFSIIHKHITPEFATIIDDFFTMYGYATNKVKVPNRNARPEWSYVKTVGCKINGIASGFGGVPADDAERIENIYNNGVRFWTNPAHIGNYSYNNAPTI